jgi:DNA-directed RNA polymerase alpha subunit
MQFRLGRVQLTPPPPNGIAMDDDATARKLAMRLSELDPTTRTANCFEQNNVTTVGQLASLKRADVWAWPNAGSKTLAEIESLLHSVGLRFDEATERVGDFPAGAKPGKAVSEKRALVGRIRLDRFPLSTRTANCLLDQEIKSVGQLARLTPSDVSEWPHAGEKTLHELRLILGSVGLSLRDDKKPAGRFDQRKLEQLLLPRGSEPKTNVMMLADAAPDVQLKLVSRIDTFPISAWAKNFAIQAKFHYLGELAQFTKKELRESKSCGLRSLKELSALLESQNLTLGLTIPDWSRKRAAELADSMSSELAREALARSGQLLARVGPEPSCLEEELSRIVAMSETPANVAVLLSLWGWNGSEPRTLASVGKDRGTGRERIRQIAVRAIERFRKYSFDTPYLRAAIQRLREENPSGDKLPADRLRDHGITRGPFSVRGIEFAAELFGVEDGGRVREAVIPASCYVSPRKD